MKHASPTRKLADAVFRGKEIEYSFKVYPLAAAITDQPAVFIISRRVIDRFGKAHHAAVCIGETDSTLAELKKHKKARCVKDHAANVVCLLKERDPETRADVLADLKTSRSFSCVDNNYKPKIDPARQQKMKPTVRPKSTKTNAKTVTAKPAAKPAKRRTRTAAAATRTRVSSRVDSNRRQHRLPKSESAVTRKAKGRTAGGGRPRKKAAA